MGDGTGNGSVDACCKVGRVAAAYGITDVDDELAARWRSSGESTGVRELARTMNRWVLAAALREADREPLDGEAGNLLRLLTEDDIPESRRLEARRRLERDGIDVDAVLADTVSHQTVHTHLRTCLDLSKAEDDDRLDRRASTLFALQNRTETVTRDALASLSDGDELGLDGFDVIVDVRVVCESCGRSHDLSALLDAGGCRCMTSV